MAVRILHDQGARAANRHRHSAGRHDRHLCVRQRGVRHIEIAHRQYERDRSGIFCAAMNRFSIDIGQLDDLDAATDAGNPRLDEPQPRLRNAVQEQMTRIRVDRERSRRR